MRVQDTDISILLIGCGNMGFALFKGWTASVDAQRIHVVEPHAPFRERVEAIGATTSSTLAGLPDGFQPDAIIIAVKPQHMLELLPQYRKLADQGAFILSVAAGVTIAAMEKAIGGRAAIARCMPNTPAAIGAGVLVYCMNASCGTREAGLAQLLLSPCGDVHAVSDERLMDAVTAVSGSGPAYLFHFIECLADAAIAAGLPEPLARAISVETVYGASLLARNDLQSPGELRAQVTSPNGTTAAALAVLMAPQGLRPLVGQAVLAAKARSIELGEA